MKEYKVFLHTSGKVEAVKQGWSWPAFFFPLIWALVKRMWGLAFGLFLAILILDAVLIHAGVSKRTTDVLVSIAIIAASIVFGINGNYWREKKLLSRGFEFRGKVTARNRKTALAMIEKGDHSTST